MTDTNRRILLAKRPEGLPGPENFRQVEEPVPEPGDGEIVIRNDYLSLDPAIRGWMDDAPSYMPPIGIGEVIRGTTVGEVVASRNADFPVGAKVVGLHGWEDYSLSQGAGFDAPIPEELGHPLPLYLSVLGATGMTAYFGLLDVGDPQPGETLLVSAAAGAVGSIVGQIGRIKGCRVVGVAGGPDKCRWLKEEFGFDEAIDYKAGRPLAEEVSRTCPDGVDIHFENVGGEILDAALANINMRGRVLLCGLIKQYNADEPAPAYNLWRLITQRARIEGILVADYVERFPEGIAAIARWMAEGRIRHREDINPGLAEAPKTFLKLFDGSNTGKLIVDLTADR